MAQRQRIFREVAKITASPPAGISLAPRDDTCNYLDAQIVGPENSPYKSGVFKVEVHISEKYPITPPTLKFLTKIYHPNIDDNGRVCLDLTKMPPKGNWRPTFGLEGLLIAVKMLLECPNPDDPLMADIAVEYKNMHAEFVKRAQMFTQKYATPTPH